MNANYAEICRVGKLKTGFQQVRNFHNIVVKRPLFKFSKKKKKKKKKKAKKYVLRQKLKKKSLTVEIT